MYYSKDEKKKSSSKINYEMKKNGVDISVKDNSEMISNLRIYYGTQGRMIESSKINYMRVNKNI